MTRRPKSVPGAAVVSLQMLITPPLHGRARLPVKIFSGVDYIVEKSTNDFVKDVRVVDVRISPPSPDDPPRVAVLILYEEGEAPPAPVQELGPDGGQPANAPRMPTTKPGHVGNDARPAATVTMPIAVWVATATLHYDEGINEVFLARKIRDKVVEQGIYKKKIPKKTIESNITQYCVSNAPPGQGNHRKLYRVRDGVYRLYRPGDDYSSGKKNGPEEPEINDLLGKHRYLLGWYNSEYCRVRLQQHDASGG